MTYYYVCDIFLYMKQTIQQKADETILEQSGLQKYREKALPELRKTTTYALLCFRLSIEELEREMCKPIVKFFNNS